MNIKINGKEIGLHFGVRAFKTFYDSITPNQEGTEEFTGHELDQLSQIIFAGHENYQYMQTRQSGNTLVSFADICKEVELISLAPERLPELTNVYNAFLNSTYVKAFAEGLNKNQTEEKGGVKKKRVKSTGKNSKA
jgi:hypothetical protein